MADSSPDAPPPPLSIRNFCFFDVLFEGELCKGEPIFVFNRTGLVSWFKDLPYFDYPESTTVIFENPRHAFILESQRHH
jgi:hypothetical protein